MKVLLDTNSLHRDYFLTKPGTVALAKEQTRGAYRVVIPEVVVEEHAKHFRRDREKLEAALSELRSVVTSDMGAVLLNPSVADYPEVLRTRLAELKIEIAGYPPVTHADVVRRAITGSAPFSAEGQHGYHDTLIWETALALCQSDTVVLVSKDAAAFGNGALHRELQLELERRGVAGRVSLVASIPDAVTQFVNPVLERLVGLEESINAGAGPVQPREWLLEEVNGRKRIDSLLWDWLQPEDFITDRTEYRHGTRHSLSARWSKTIEIKKVLVSSARQLEGGQVLVQVDVDLVGEASYDDDVLEEGTLYESATWEQQHGVEVQMELLIDMAARGISDGEIRETQIRD